MKALTLWQPWATLITIGAKTIETRSWSTTYRGPLAIHAVARRPDYGDVGEYLVEPFYDHVRHIDVHDCACEEDGIAPECARRSKSRMVMSTTGGKFINLPLGAVVATANLVDVVATDELEGDGFRVWLIDPSACPEHSIYAEIDAPEDCETTWDVDDQRPYGDFSPGRFAWLLEDVQPVDPPVPAKGHQGLWEWSP